jgi:hypothetical protein
MVRGLGQLGREEQLRGGVDHAPLRHAPRASRQGGGRNEGGGRRRGGEAVGGEKSCGGDGDTLRGLPRAPARVGEAARAAAACEWLWGGAGGCLRGRRRTAHARDVLRVDSDRFVAASDSGVSRP